MAKGKDPAFLFYPGDASEDTQFLNRLERGCYFDLLKAQKKFRRFTLPLIKKVLGADFEACWPAVESVLRKEGELYFIGWADDAIENRAAHAEKQKKRIKDYWDKKKQSESVPEVNQNDTTEQPKQTHGTSLENGNANENEDEIEIELLGKGMQGERYSDDWFNSVFDDIHMGKVKSTFPKHDVDNEFKIFKLKVRGSPTDYNSRDSGGMRNAFIYQLKHSTSTNEHRIKPTGTLQPTTAIIEPDKSFGVEKGFSRSGSN